MKANIKVSWGAFRDARQIDTMTWAEFRKAFDREFLRVNMMYVRAQEYLNLRYGHKTVKKFFTRLNALAWYALSVANTDKAKT